MEKKIRNRVAYEIIAKSENKEWKEAVKEWKIENCYEDIKRKKECICGKEHLQYKYKLVNRKNGKIIYPIGKKCIKKLGVEELNREAEMYVQKINLEHKMAKGDYLSIEDKDLSKRVIKHMYNKGVFQGNKYNEYNSKKDYQFVINMKNKKNKFDISNSEEKKLNAMLLQMKGYLSKRGK